MYKFTAIFLFSCVALFGVDRGESIKAKLLASYPQIKTIEGNRVVFDDNSSLIFDDGKQKTTEQALEDADIEDMFKIEYDRNLIAPKEKESESGRFRSEPFFKKIYGKTKADVERNLETVTWFDGTQLKANKINGVSEKLARISSSISKLPKEISDIAKAPSGAYYYRTIKGTNRLSMHSFGIAFDLDLKSGEYWLFDLEGGRSATCCSKPIPRDIVDIFEKEGFIWGGRWHSYDTIHFEYRPELL